jgi:hypothetical protein
MPLPLVIERNTMRRTDVRPAACSNAARVRPQRHLAVRRQSGRRERAFVESGKRPFAHMFFEARRHVVGKPFGAARQPLEVEPCSAYDEQHQRYQRSRPYALPADDERCAQPGVGQHVPQPSRLVDMQRAAIGPAKLAWRVQQWLRHEGIAEAKMLRRKPVCRLERRRRRG